MIALDNREGSTLGSDEAKYMWVYIVFPYIGALMAALLFKYHQSIDNQKRAPSE
jgi:glycerol uptake facilitator-like aquaporin